MQKIKKIYIKNTNFKTILIDNKKILQLKRFNVKKLH